MRDPRIRDRMTCPQARVPMNTDDDIEAIERPGAPFFEGLLNATLMSIPLWVLIYHLLT